MKKFVGIILVIVLVVISSTTVFASQKNPVKADIHYNIWPGSITNGRFVTGQTVVSYQPTWTVLKLEAKKYPDGKPFIPMESGRAYGPSCLGSISKTGYTGRITVYSTHEVSSNGSDVYITHTTSNV